MPPRRPALSSPVSAGGLRWASIPPSGPLRSRSLWSSLGLSGHPFGGPGGDVGADLHSVEGDPAGRTVSALTGGGGGRPQPRHVEDAASGGDDLAVPRRRPRVGHLG